ncbi:DsbA family protein [Sphingomonas sp. 28-62-20]|uniref:DsbA family protein n=1 Tax=Sphingomonas sp. 28-62-20 TaxID=1970433 RepID=UPI0026D59FA8
MTQFNMISGNRWLLLGVAAISAVIGAGAVAGVNHLSGSTLATPQRAAMERVVHDYVLAHPEIIPEAMGLMRDRETGRGIAANRDAILTPFGNAWVGNPNGDVTLVEYFDYNCGYCRSSLPTITKLVASDPNVRIIFRELPILSAESRSAARLSLVAAERGRFKQFHEALYAGGPISDTSMARAMQAAGLDPQMVQQAVNNPRIDAEIDSNLRVAQQLGMTGTPSWVIGDHVVSAALPIEELQRLIAKQRAKS